MLCIRRPVAPLLCLGVASTITGSRVVTPITLRRVASTSTCLRFMAATFARLCPIASTLAPWRAALAVVRPSCFRAACVNSRAACARSRAACARSCAACARSRAALAAWTGTGIARR